MLFYKYNTNSIYFSLILRRSGRACETRHVLIRPMKSGFVPLPDLRNNETLLIRNGITQVATYVPQSDRLCQKGANWQWTLQMLANYQHFFIKGGVSRSNTYR